MRLTIATEARFVQGSDGYIYSDTGTRGYEFWSQYLSVFTAVTVVGRVITGVEGIGARVEGPGVNVFPIPGYRGPWDFVRKYRSIKDQIDKLKNVDGALILRIPGPLNTLIWKSIPKEKPYAVEVVGDAYAAFSRGGIRHPLRELFKYLYYYSQRAQCKQAIGALYVTEEYLQQKYPCPKFSIGVSDVNISDDALVPKAREIHMPKDTINIITVGSLENFHKAPDILLKAVACCVRKGINIKLAFIGDGRHRKYLEDMAEEIGIKANVSFRGRLPAGEAVRREIDKADLFILPSRTEGLPRALIEAMARGLPCIATNVGGIPELLSPDNLVPPNDEIALAEKIFEVVRNLERLSDMSRVNLEKARCYHTRSLFKKKEIFLNKVKEKCGFIDRSSYPDVNLSGDAQHG